MYQFCFTYRIAHRAKMRGALLLGSLLLGLWSCELHAATPYSTSIEGPVAEDTLALLREFSDTIHLEDSPPASVIHLRRRVTRDQERFLSTLQSLGHYGAKVEASIENDDAPYRVRFQVEPGPAYRVGSIAVEAPDVPADAVPLPDGRRIGLATGDFAKASAILDAESQVSRIYQQQGYPFARAGERRMTVDHATREAHIVLVVESGPRAVFGAISIAGLEKVDESVVLQRIQWEEGESFDREKLRATQRALYDTGLFGLTSVTTADNVSPDGTLPLYIELTERKHRTYAIGLRFDTDQGVGAELSWEHRNMRRQGHKLRLATRLRTEVSEAIVGYHIDQFRRDDQRLVTTLRLAREDLDAYKSNLAYLSSLVERDVTPSLTVGAGVAVSFSDSSQGGRSRNHQFISLPMKADLDRSNDLLNPTRGYRISARAEPFADVFKGDSLFLKSDLTFTHYLPINKDESWVLATRMRTGSIFGESLEGVPPPIRFFSGGGGSIRGFPYRTVSPLDATNTPVGGRSTLEAAVELRRRISETLGFVTFVDAGSAFESAWPDFDASVRYAAGIGFRYFTTIGPLRFDIAVPINRRKGIDDSFEFYLSIGQAF